MTTSLAHRFQLKAGQRMIVMNAPPGYLDRFATDLEGHTLTAGAMGPADAVLLFVNSQAELERLVPDGIRAVKLDGLLWIAYPKGASKVGTDINRDRLWEAMVPTGWRPVRQIALDEVWSAVRFRPAQKVGT